MKIVNLLLITGMFGLSISCKKSDSEKNTEAKLIKVSCAFGEGIIDATTDTVIIKAPEATDITQIIPQFEISKNATIYPPSGVATNFTNPVIYTITSEDNVTKYVFTVIAIKPIVKFTVHDCSNWSPLNTSALQPNATIKVYTSALNVGTTKTYEVLTTDQNAEAVLYGLRTNNYYITAEKDNKSNIVNGYVLIGNYNTQAEVDNYPLVPNAKVGDLKFMDWNGDMRLDLNDKINYQEIWSQYDLNRTTILSKDLYIANKN